MTNQFPSKDVGWGIPGSMLQDGSTVCELITSKFEIQKVSS